jgi:hypothetical protein
MYIPRRRGKGGSFRQGKSWKRSGWLKFDVQALASHCWNT